MRYCSMLVMIFVFIMPFRTEAMEQEVYVAIGDSLAAGQTPYSQIDAGYSDFIALQLKRNGNLAHFTKELSFPGYRVSNVLESVQSEKTDALLKEATLITISAGANNLLPLLSYNPNAGTIAFSQLSANFALNEVRVQMRELLELLQKKAPAAKIYVMGYYFPYVSVHEKQIEGAVTSLNLLNRILKQETKQAGAHFVDVYDDFSKHAKTYLPNLADIHPNQNGYRLMANRMLGLYRGDSPLNMQEEAMPKPNPLTFDEILSIRNGDGKARPADTRGVMDPAPIQTNKPYPIAI